ncbi:response regulator [Anaerolineales bacterium HSG24]|nr:response regulator [Anaerolineales bacterium HSG24]
MDIEPRILIVDDEENLLRSMEKTLFRQGFDVGTAGGNIEGIEAFDEAVEDEEPFDLVIVDLNMPDFDGNEQKYAGLDLLAKIKEDHDVPVIVNSAWDEVEIAKKCIDAGASDYFVKGRNEEMLRKIHTVLGIE